MGVYNVHACYFKLKLHIMEDIGGTKKVDPLLKAQIFLPILGLLRPTIYQINGN